MYPDNMDPSKFQGWYDSSWSHNMEYVAHKAVEFIEDNQGEDWFLYMVSHSSFYVYLNKCMHLIQLTLYLESYCSTRA